MYMSRIDFLFIYLCIYVLFLYLCTHLVDAVQDVVSMQKYSNLDGLHCGRVRWVSSKMGHVGPIEGPFCGTVTFGKNLS